jgi:hypothetical protein
VTSSEQAGAVRQREAALRRIRRTRGWAIAGAGALTAAIALAVSAAVPGRTLGAKTAAARGRAAALSMPPLATPGELGLRAPNSPPLQQTLPQPTTPQPSAPVVSGGS